MTYSYMCFVHCQVMKVLLEVVVWFQSLYDPFKYLETNQNNCLSNLHSCPSQDLVPQDADLIQTWVFLHLLLKIYVVGPRLLFSRGPMQVDPPAFKKSRHECSHFLRQLENVTSGNLTDFFKEVSADSLVTQHKKCVRENLKLLWKPQPSMMHSECCTTSVHKRCQLAFLSVLLYVNVMQVYYYFIISTKRCDCDTAWANGREIPCSALSRQVCSDGEVALSAGLVLCLVFLMFEYSHYN